MTLPPEYPFQQTVADMFHHEGHMYIAYAERLTGKAASELCLDFLGGGAVWEVGYLQLAR